MKKIGAITVGQAPRVDVTCDILDLFPKDIKLLEKGGLDGLTKEEISKFEPQNGDYVLVSRMNDGSSVTFAERFIVDRLQKGIDELEKQGVCLIMVFCTGQFPKSLHSNVPMVFPEKLLTSIVPLLSSKKCIAAVTPSKLQLSQNAKKWENFVKRCVSIAGSPYDGLESLIPVAKSLANRDDIDLIVLDCIGFTKEMKKMFMEITKKPVILPRTLLARIASEMVD